MATKNSKRKWLDARLRTRFLSRGRAARLLLLRRAAALVLAAVAGILAFQSRPGPAATTVPVLVAARDLPAGHAVSGSDVETRTMPAAMTPEGALRDADAVVGRVLSGASRRGEVLTDARLLGPPPVQIPGSVSVPIRLADPGVAEFLRPGRTVDVVSALGESSQSPVLAERAVIVAIGRAESQDRNGRLVVVAAPEEQARKLAAATLTQSVAITLR